jgi:hypothetical protein
MFVLGGTTMRAILYDFARVNGFNMTSNYGTVSEHNVPFSHNKGSTPNFMYGHVRNEFIRYATQSEKTCLANKKDRLSKDRTLYIFMIREPTSWIFSRYLHHKYHYDLGLAKEVFQNISEFSMTYAPEYLEFLDDVSRDYSAKWFKESMVVSGGGAGPIPNPFRGSPFRPPAAIGP